MAVDIKAVSLLLNILVCQFGVLGIETGEELVTRLEPVLKERAAAVRHLMTPLTDDIAADLVEHAARRYIPVQALSEECRAHSNLLLTSLLQGDTWALKMYDASSKLQPVMLHDHFMDLGRYEQCVSVQVPGQLFSGKHCVVETKGILPRELHDYLNWDLSGYEFEEEYAKLIFPDVEVTFAVCVPSTCSFQDVHAHVTQTLSLINSTAVMYEESCSTGESLPFRVKDWLAMFFFFGIALLVVLSTLYESRNSGQKSELLSAFSLISNWKTLAESRSEGELSCLEGTRVIVTCIVVIFHRLWISWMTPSESYNTVIENVRYPGAALFELFIRAVDIFLLIGGTIRSYKFFKDRHQGKPLDILRNIIRRYFRYTPTLAVVMVFTATFFIHSGSGPLWKRLNTLPCWTCSHLWWLSLLHVTNYVNPFAMCEMQSWYLACDFQLFLFSPLFLLPLYYRPRLGLSLLAFYSTASLVASFLNSYLNQVYGGAISFCLRHRKLEVMDSAYYATHLRATPYLLGIALGYLLFNVLQRKRRITLSQTVLRTGWILSVTSVLLLFLAARAVVGPDREFSPWLDPLYTSLSKPIVAAVVAWLVLVHESQEREGLLSMFLKWKGFQPLAKLNLGVYMVHLNVIRIQNNKLHHPIIISYLDSLFLGLGDLMISFPLAVVLYLSVEKPCCRLIDYLLRSSTSQRTYPIPVIKDNNYEELKTD